MVDIHTHTIPGLDDGALNYEESLEILQSAEADGVDTIVATPHILASLFFSKLSSAKNIAALDEKFSRLKKTAEDGHLRINVLRGAENYFDSLLKEKLNEHADILTLNGSDYFLLEFPPKFVFPGVKQLMFDLLTDGFIPIICHPERNFIFQQYPGLLFQFIQLGAYSQIDAGSIRGDYGKAARKTAFLFLKLNLVHVIASDCHRSVLQPPGLSFLYERLEKLGREKVELLIDGIPRAILNNQAPPSIGQSLDPDGKSFFRRFFGRLHK
jgi:protein-tyrosine phosphatase